MVMEMKIKDRHKDCIDGLRVIGADPGKIQELSLYI